MGSEFEINGKKMIFNGGDNLSGAPKDWGEFDKWVYDANDKADWINDIDEHGRLSTFHGPSFTADCGFKLDFDGEVLGFSSRFYPPATHYGSSWDGTLTVMVLGEELWSVNFEEASFKELTSKVQKYTEKLSKKLKDFAISELDKGATQ